MTCLSFCLNIVLLIFVGAICVHYNLIGKVSIKMGLKEEPITQDQLITKDFTNTLLSVNYEADAVFFGASITSDGKWECYFPNLNICTLGKSGDKLETMIARVPQISAVRPKKIFLAPEQNDLHSSTVEEIEKAFRVLLDTIQNTNPQSQIYIEGLLPMNEKKFCKVSDNTKVAKVNERLQGVALEKGLDFIDLYTPYLENGQLPMELSTDGQHLKPVAYRRWVNEIAPYINEIER
jgi:lysophospholipase L1-like esterase